MLEREAISSVDVTNLSQDVPIPQLKGLKIASALPIEIQDSSSGQRPCQSLVCLEFRIGQDPLNSLATLRQVNTSSFNTLYEFKLAGSVHGKSLTSETNQREEGFVLQIRGEDIASALMHRISEIRSKMSEVGSNMKHFERITVTAPIKNSANARIAFQFHIANLK